jgi:hypothetical protein
MLYRRYTARLPALEWLVERGSVRKHVAAAQPGTQSTKTNTQTMKERTIKQATKQHERVRWLRGEPADAPIGCGHGSAPHGPDFGDGPAADVLVERCSAVEHAVPVRASEAAFNKRALEL